MATDILGYKGKRVVVMGCFSGTGEACARLLVDLGAEVHGADIKPSPVNLASFTEIDLKSPDAIATGVAKIGGKIDAVFNVSGLPQTFPGEDVVTVNFLGIRAWTEGWIPHLNPGAAIVTVSSLAGMAYLTRQPLLREIMAITDFPEARQYYLDRAAELGDPYTLSKELHQHLDAGQRSRSHRPRHSHQLHHAQPDRHPDARRVSQNRRRRGARCLCESEGALFDPGGTGIAADPPQQRRGALRQRRLPARRRGIGGGLATGVLNIQQMIAEATAA